MSAVYIPSGGPDGWRQFLADPERQWRTGYSARTLAYSWEAAGGLPPEVAALFGASAELLIGLPEHKVALPGGRRESQNDIFALVRHDAQICAVAVEGKVSEPFGPSLAEWMTNASPGKQHRLTFICELLGLQTPPPPTIRYQLLHRTASAVIEARRFMTQEAAMIVHSFSPRELWFEDFSAFLKLFGFEAQPGKAYQTALPSGMSLRLGWAKGDQRFLAA